MLAGAVVARSLHFALHRAELDDLACVQQAPVFSVVGASLPFARQDVWMGAVVPKRWAKRAVRRNAIKRQITAVSNNFETVLLTAAYVVRLHAGFDHTQFTSSSSTMLKIAVRQELQQLFACVTASRRVTAPVGGAP